MKKKIGVVVAIGVMLLGTSPLAGMNTSFSEKNETSVSPIKSLSQQNEEYDMVIISPELFSSELRSLIDHKNGHNVRTFLKTTEDIYTEYQGRDEAEKVKYFIKDALETVGIEYVLLVGGRKGQSFDWHVPVRYSKLDDGFGYSEFLSDLYFADIYSNGNEFEDWDSDGDGVFAEWSTQGKDTLDLYPDVSVGRLPCRNRFEVRAIVDKIIAYENNAYGQPWLNRMVVVGGNTFPQFDEGSFPYEGEATCDIAADYMNGFEVRKLYTSEGGFTGPDDVIDAINQGCGFFFTRGRGGTDRVRMVTSDGTEFIALHTMHIPKLENADMYPVCVLGECIHGKFDVGLFNFLRGTVIPQQCVPECIAWRLVRKNDGGIIACITNTNICYGIPGDNDNDGVPDDVERLGGWLAVEFFRLYGEEGKTTLGDIHTGTIANYLEHFPAMANKEDCKSIQEWILIGDPSLRIGGYS